MNEKGVVLITSFLVITVLSILGAATLSHSISERRVTQAYTESVQALCLAEAGVQRALWEFNYGSGSWTGWTDVSGNKQLTGTLGSLGSYQVTVNDPTGNNPTINASGHIPDAATNRVERDVEADVGLETESPFTYAGFGKTSVTMNGGGTSDSYDSDDGAYGGANVGSNGDIGTNSGEEDAINLNGTNVTINGDAGTGAGGTVDIGGSTVTGETSDDVSEDMASVTVPETLTDLDTSGSISLNNSSVPQTINAGSYKYSSISLSGSSLTFQGTVEIYLTETNNALKITGGSIIVAAGANVTIYTDGKCDIGGNGIVNSTNVPANLIFYSTYTGNNGFNVSAGNSFYGAVYAPDADINVTGTGDVYGSLVSNVLKVTGGGDIHYDEALADVGEGSTSYVVQLWEDLQTPY